MKNYLIRLFLYTCIALVPISCGTRKTATKILKNAEIVEVKEESKGQVKKVEEHAESTKEVARVENKQEDKSIIVTELFSDDGVIKSRVKEVKIGKTTNNTTNIKTSLKTLYINTDSVFNNNYYRVVEVTKYVKDKTVSTNRNGLYYLLGFLGLAGLVLWLKPWVK